MVSVKHIFAPPREEAEIDRQILSIRGKFITQHTYWILFCSDVSEEIRQSCAVERQVHNSAHWILFCSDVSHSSPPPPHIAVWQRILAKRSGSRVP
ncbi:hypothetical protein PROFUN_15178 [Planoprotostelium fungivorum]|uniref:Uncharacterized protein n=1 Tax=Planoprotostelium fungivorum TaxID=1890364 RepID=A0A2P6MVW9_9EUKA|nr:hypothetical protein PROFUN_15178 [Planoprotostelium fungivorum]